MKKLNGILSMIMALSMLMALLPTGSVFAGKDPGTVVLEIHNATGGEITMNLVDADGTHHIFHISVGVSEITVGQGWHSYAANTGCGTRNGSFNLNAGKQVYFSCGSTDLSIANIAQGGAADAATSCAEEFGFFNWHDHHNCNPWHHHHGW